MSVLDSQDFRTNDDVASLFDKQLLDDVRCNHVLPVVFFAAIEAIVAVAVAASSSDSNGDTQNPGNRQDAGGVFRPPEGIEPH